MSAQAGTLSIGVELTTNVHIPLMRLESVHMNECVKAQGTKCIQEELAPILHFGSVFRRDIFPSMLAMPMPQNNHLGCFHNWVLHRQVCEYYQPRGPANPSGLIFPEHVGMEWDLLINSIIWRGTDFSFLHKFDPTMRHPDFDMDIEQQVDLSIEKRLAGIQALRQIYDDLVPRWKGVAWTAEAELEVYDMRMLGVPAWCNIKFSAAMSMGKKVPTNDLDIYRRYEEYGIPASGEGMSLEAMAEYKYREYSSRTTTSGSRGIFVNHDTPTYHPYAFIRQTSTWEVVEEPHGVALLRSSAYRVYCFTI